MRQRWGVLAVAHHALSLVDVWLDNAVPRKNDGSPPLTSYERMVIEIVECVTCYQES